MITADHFSKSAAEASKRRKESNAGHKEKIQIHGGNVSNTRGPSDGPGARKVAQQNRVKHRAEFEMQMGVAPHPIRPGKVTSRHSESSISQQQQRQQQRQHYNRRKWGCERGVAYICLGLLGGFFLITGALIVVFGFTSDGFSWTSATIGMILAYCGIAITTIGILFVSSCIAMCCADRRHRKDTSALEKMENDGDMGKESDLRSEQFKSIGKQNGKNDHYHSEQTKSNNYLEGNSTRVLTDEGVDNRILSKTPSCTT